MYYFTEKEDLRSVLEDFDISHFEHTKDIQEPIIEECNLLDTEMIIINEDERGGYILTIEDEEAHISENLRKSEYFTFFVIALPGGSYAPELIRSWERAEMVRKDWYRHLGIKDNE